MDPQLLSLDIYNITFLINILLIIVLLFLSAIFSGSEVAYFSLSPNDLHKIKEESDVSSKRVLSLLESPNRVLASKKLLATILIANNFVNVAIVLLSTFIADQLIPDSFSLMSRNIIQIGVVTFVLVLFGEVIPKVYATSNNVQMAKIVSKPLQFLKKIFTPLSNILIRSTNFIDKRFQGKNDEALSTDELEHAIHLSNVQGEDKKIYQGIVNFGNIISKQSMTARTDIFAFNIEIEFLEVLSQIKECKYSRIPVYTDDLDTISGVLYIKDLIPHLNKDKFDWKTLIRPSFFIPELKKLDDLMKEFQHRKNHMAIVVDEYGGTSGLITLEDVLEEIVGEITDEYDEDGLSYSKLDENIYLFEAKTSLPDMYRILNIDGKELDDLSSESSTIGGLVIEIAGKIPMKGEKIKWNNYTFVIDASDKRKLKRIKLIIEDEE